MFRKLIALGLLAGTAAAVLPASRPAAPAAADVVVDIASPTPIAHMAGLADVHTTREIRERGLVDDPTGPYDLDSLGPIAGTVCDTKCWKF
jgi:hypothetical protein